MRRQHVLLSSFICGMLILAVPWPAPQAQVAPTRYTFTRIAEHGFLQVVEGSGADPLPQHISTLRRSINDQGVVAFGHAGQFPFNRTVVSTGDGTTIRQFYGGGLAAPSTDVLGIDGEGHVYLFTSPPDPLCPPTTGDCIIGPDGIIASRTAHSTPVDFLVNGAHARLRPPGAARVAYYAATAAGYELLTEAGLVAAPGGVFSSIARGEHDINASGEVVFMGQTVNGFGIFAGRAGEALRTVFLNYNNPGGIGFVNIHSPRIDDSGRVFFSANAVGALQNDLYRIDPGSQEPVVVIDGNNGPLVMSSTIAVAVNGAGGLAFLATRGLGGPAGIYTGPDPVADKVVEVGDLLDGRAVVDLTIGERAINNNGVAGRGQIAFVARLDGDDGFSLYRADPPGATGENPILPLQKVPGAKTYKFARTKMACQGGCVSYWDPPFAVGYEYSVEPGDPRFESVIPPSFATHDTYELELWNGTEWDGAGPLTGDAEHVFAAGGVDRFRITGIPESLGLDVDDPVAFVTGLRFVDAGASDTVELSMTVLTAAAPVTLTWDTPPPIVYGTLLGPTELDATSTAPGTFSYTPAAGTVLDAGTHTLSVTFTPDDPGHAAATSSVVLEVLPAPLTITADDQTMVIGDPLPTLTATHVGFVHTDTVASLDVGASLSTTATGASAGDFPIAVAGASDANYLITFVPGTLSVRDRHTTCAGAPGRTALWPINANGTSVFKKGSSVLVRFRVCSATGIPIGTPGLVTSFRLVHTENGTAVSHVNELPLLLPPSTSFQWNPFLKEWFFVLSTRTLATGKTYSYRIGLRDGSAIDFRFGVR